MVGLTDREIARTYTDNVSGPLDGLKVVELAVRASGLAVQLLGAAGYMEDHPTELWYRDAKQLTIVEGTSQVQLDLIARGVLGHDLWWD